MTRAALIAGRALIRKGFFLSAAIPAAIAAAPASSTRRSGRSCFAVDNCNPCS
jgi:hypothetical protein